MTLIFVAEKNRVRISSEGGFQAVVIMAASLVSHIQYAAARIILSLSEDSEFVVLSRFLVPPCRFSPCNNDDDDDNIGRNFIIYFFCAEDVAAKILESNIPNTVAELLCCETDSVQYVAASAINNLAQSSAFADIPIIASVILIFI
jgi:hypothetical protein